MQHTATYSLPLARWMCHHYAFRLGNVSKPNWKPRCRRQVLIGKTNAVTAYCKMHRNVCLPGLSCMHNELLWAMQAVRYRRETTMLWAFWEKGFIV